MAENENATQQNAQQELLQNAQRTMGLGMFFGPVGILTGAAAGMAAGNTAKEIAEFMQKGQQQDGFGTDGQQFDPKAMSILQLSGMNNPLISKPAGMGPNMGQNPHMELTDAQKEKFGEFIESLSTEQKVQLFTEMYQGGQQQQMQGQGLGKPDFSQSRSDGFIPWAKSAKDVAVNGEDAMKTLSGGLAAVPVLNMMPSVLAAGALGQTMGKALEKQFGDENSSDAEFKDRIAENQRGGVDPRLGVDMNTLDASQSTNPGMQYA